MPLKTDLVHYSLIEGAKLPLEMKKVFQLIYMEGFSASEVADKLNLSVEIQCGFRKATLSDAYVKLSQKKGC